MKASTTLWRIWAFCSLASALFLVFTNPDVEAGRVYFHTGGLFFCLAVAAILDAIDRR